MDEFNAYFAKLDPVARRIAEGLSALLDEEKPNATKKLAWGFPCWIGNERIFSVIGHADRCNLQLWSGARLSGDWPGRIEGTGKSIRHVKVRELREIDEELSAIVAAAAELDRTAPERIA